MTRKSLLRHALFFGLGYTLSVMVIRWSGVDYVLSRGRWVQHYAADLSDLDAEDAGRTFPQMAQRGGKNHDTVKLAFRDIVKEARLSTVTLYHKDRPISLGTVVRKDGYVVAKASELPAIQIECALSDGRHVSAERVTADPDCDLALLRLATAELPEAPWSDEAPQVGSLLASTSNSSTPVAIGVVSVPLIDIPRNPGLLGIRMHQGRTGPVVSEALPESAAEAAGLQSGDVILTVDDARVLTTRQLSEAIRRRWPGDVVRLSIERENQVLNVDVKLIREDDLDVENRDFQYELGGPLSTRRSGFGRVIQHDTVLTPEQCGGPLVDVSGRVVGVNIARAERIATYALPAATVRESVDRMLRTIDATRRVESVAREIRTD